MKQDEDYIEVRNGLIDDAEKYANEKCGSCHKETDADLWGAEWNRALHTKMDALVRKFYRDATDQWIIGSDCCRAYLHAGSWKSAKRWIQRYNAPLRHWVDGRPVFLKSEIDEFLKSHGPDKII